MRSSCRRNDSQLGKYTVIFQRGQSHSIHSLRNTFNIKFGVLFALLLLKCWLSKKEKNGEMYSNGPSSYSIAINGSSRVVDWDRTWRNRFTNVWVAESVCFYWLLISCNRGQIVLRFRCTTRSSERFTVGPFFEVKKTERTYNELKYLNWEGTCG